MLISDPIGNASVIATLIAGIGGGFWMLAKHKPKEKTSLTAIFSEFVSWMRSDRAEQTIVMEKQNSLLDSLIHGTELSNQHFENRHIALKEQLDRIERKL